MIKRTLSPEIVSLIHHVELNKNGWWNKAVGQVVRGVLWMEGGNKSIAELSEAIRTEIGITVSNEVLNQQLEILSSEGEVMKLVGNVYRLSINAEDKLTAEKNKAVEEQEECRSIFLESCKLHCQGLEPEVVWTKFYKQLLNAIRITGANLYELLTDGELNNDIEWFSSFIRKFETEYHNGLKSVMYDFFKKDNSACRNQVLRYLTAHFFAEASQLKPETLALIESGKKTRDIKIVLDTNMVFSILNLHNNPANDAALSLAELVNKKENNLEIKMFVLQSTVDEAIKVLSAQVHNAEGVRPTSAMIGAVRNRPMPGIVRRYIESGLNSQYTSAKEYYDTFIQEFPVYLKDKNIHILDTNTSSLAKNQGVIDDIHAIMDEEKNLPEEDRKTYENVSHDVILWHAVNQRRFQKEDSLLAIEYWAVSLDSRLIKFGNKKSKNSASKSPIVLHPSNLVQLIQFWLPRTPELEENIIDALRLPLFFKSFSPEDERATLKVLATISRFENHEDIAEDSIKHILTNQAIRSRFANGEITEEDAVELITNEFISENKLLNTKLDEKELQLDDRDLELTNIKNVVESTNEQLADKERVIAGLTAEQNLTHKDLSQLKGENTKIKKEYNNLTVRAETAERTNARLMYILSMFGPFVFIVFVMQFINIPWESIIKSMELNWRITHYGAFDIPIYLLSLCVPLMFSKSCVEKNNMLKDWKVARIISFVGSKWIMAPISIVTVALIGESAAKFVSMIFDAG